MAPAVLLAGNNLAPQEAFSQLLIFL